MFWFHLFHPHISLVRLRVYGAIDIAIMLIALAAIEFSPRRHKTLKRLYPIFIIGTLFLIYVILISQGAIH